jgi:hypothetical protein
VARFGAVVAENNIGRVSSSKSKMNSLVVKRGNVHVKEDGIRSFLWSKKWLILREQTLTFHRNEVHTD